MSVLGTVVRIATAPVYVPVSVAVWAFLWATDAQGSIQAITEQMRRFAESREAK